MRVLIVDPDPQPRQALHTLLNREEDVAVVGECANALDAVAAIHRQKPDAVFLDIRMPRIDGLEMLRMLDPDDRPHIVFLADDDQYALQAFEENAFDYLLKPPAPGRLGKTLQRLRSQPPHRGRDGLAPSAPLCCVPCQGANRIVLIRPPDIDHVCSRLSGVYVVDRHGNEHFTELTLRTLEERSALVRCHRQHMVNLDAIVEIRLCDSGGADIVTRNGHLIAVSRRYLKALKQRIGIAE